MVLVLKPFATFCHHLLVLEALQPAGGSDLLITYGGDLLCLPRLPGAHASEECCQVGLLVAGLHYAFNLALCQVID